MSEAGETWRLFVAVPLPKAAVAGASAAQATLRSAAPRAKIRWTPPHQFHLTLRFLGEVASGRVPELEEQLGAACAGRAAMHLHLHGMGFFPHARRPRVVWVGLQGELNALHALQQAVARAVEGFAESGVSVEKFSAHITLGRIKTLTPAERAALVEAAETTPVRPERWTAEAVHLMRSTLSAEGAQHQCLAAWPLAGSVCAEP